MFSFANGYYAIALGPKHERKIKIYRITQILLCILWFVFSIIGAGCFNGWVKIKTLSKCGLGFSIFLVVVESLLYLTACGLGIFCVVKSFRVSIFYH